MYSYILLFNVHNPASFAFFIFAFYRTNMLSTRLDAKQWNISTARRESTGIRPSTLYKNHLRRARSSTKAFFFQRCRKTKTTSAINSSSRSWLTHSIEYYSLGAKWNYTNYNIVEITMNLLRLNKPDLFVINEHNSEHSSQILIAITVILHYNFKSICWSSASAHMKMKTLATTCHQFWF